jgi:hypothetical protein
MIRVIRGLIGPEDVDRFIEFSKCEYDAGAPLDSRSISWRHLENPAGPSTATELEVDGERIARIWAQGNVWRLGGTELLLSSPIDLLIHPRHRGIQTFLKIFKEGMASSFVIADGVLHTSNLLTNDIYRKFLKKSPVADLDGAVFPMSPFLLAQELLNLKHRRIYKIGDSLFRMFTSGITKVSSRTIAFVPAPTEREQELLVEKFYALHPFARRRNQSDREWRYAGEGIFQYNTEWIAKKGILFGYVVTTDRIVNNVKGRFVLDLVLGEQLSKRDLVSMWFIIIRKAQRELQNALFFFYNAKNKEMKRVAGFPMVTVKRKQLPQEIPIFIDFGSSEVATDSYRVIEEGYFVLADLDTF